MGQSRVPNKFHTFCFCHSHSHKRYSVPSQPSAPSRKGVHGCSGDIRAKMDMDRLECPREAKSRLLFFSTCKQSRSESSVDQQTPLSQCQRSLFGVDVIRNRGADGLVPTPGGGRSIRVCLDMIFSRLALRHGYSLDWWDPRQGDP